MQTFAKSVLTGFAFSLGAALFRKIAPKLGLDDAPNGKKDAEKAQATEPLQKDAGGEDAERAEPPTVRSIA
jgi:hypothetical protein